MQEIFVNIKNGKKTEQNSMLAEIVNTLEEIVLKLRGCLDVENGAAEVFIDEKHIPKGHPLATGQSTSAELLADNTSFSTKNNISNTLTVNLAPNNMITSGGQS